MKKGPVLPAPALSFKPLLIADARRLFARHRRWGVRRRGAVGWVQATEHHRGAAEFGTAIHRRLLFRVYCSDDCGAFRAFFGLFFFLFRTNLSLLRVLDR